MVTGCASPRRSQKAMDPSEAPEATMWACVGCVASEVTPTADASPEVRSEVRDGDSDCRDEKQKIKITLFVKIKRVILI